MSLYYRIGLSNLTASFCVRLVGILCILFSSSVHAQTSTNAYEISDKCYQYMLKINRTLNEPVAYQMCDTLQQMARREHDLKAECISYSLRAIHLSHIKSVKLIEEFPGYKEFIEKTPYLQYLYNIWCNLSDLYSALGQTEKSFQVVEEMRKDAMARNNYYGIQKSYYKIGVFYLNRSDYAAAIPNFEKALKILYENRDKNLYATESYLAICYEYTSRMEEARTWMLKSIEHAPEAYKGQMLILYMGMISRNPKNFSENEFLSVKNRVESKNLHKTVKSRSVNDNYYSAVCEYYLRKGLNEKALAYSDSIGQKRTRVPARLRAYWAMERWDSAFAYSLEKNTLDKEAWRERNSQSLAAVAAAIDSSRLALENKQILISQLEERQRVMELQSLKQTLETQNNALELSNRNHELQAERQKVKLSESENQINKLKYERQKQRNREMEEQRDKETRHFYTIVIILCILLFYSVVIGRIRSKSKKRLAREKDIAVKAREQAERADSLKTLFLQNMSHEIRTPLNAIVGFSEILNTPDMADAMEPEERAEMSKLIGVNSGLLLTLINDILDISKLESGTYKLQLSEVDAHKLCRDSLRSVAGRENRQVRVELDLPPLTTIFKSDEQRLQQILTNFLTNACKNTLSGKITLGYSPVLLHGMKYLRFYVEDTGCGIPQDKIETIFQRFEKLDSFKQGTGLGLSICQDISKLLNATIYVDPSYTGGARFVFEHPLDEVTK